MISHWLQICYQLIYQNDLLPINNPSLLWLPNHYIQSFKNLNSLLYIYCFYFKLHHISNQLNIKITTKYLYHDSNQNPVNESTRVQS